MENTTATAQIALVKVVAEAAKLQHVGAKFASILYTSKESGEVAKFVVLLGTHYGRMLESSLKLVAKKKVTDDLTAVAKAEVIASLNQSLLSFNTDTVNPDYTCADTYEPITAGVKAHKTEGQIYVSGVVISKKVIKAGTYKTVNSKPLTLAKNALKKSAPISKWRQFILAADNVDLLRLGGKEIRFAS